MEVPTKDEVDKAMAIAEADRTADYIDVIARHKANIDCYENMILSMDVSTTAGRLVYHLVRTCKKPRLHGIREACI